MKNDPKCRVLNGYMLIEALVYIGVSFLLLGCGFTVMYRCIDSSVALRRSADDLTGALHVGERWRADVRAAVGPIKVDNSPDEQLLHLPGSRNEILYRYTGAAVFRRVGLSPWSQLLTNISSSTVQPHRRGSVVVWTWELELKTRAKASRIRPLFTFIAAAPESSKP